MPRLPRISGARAAAGLRKLGFEDHHQRGGHLVLKHADGRRAVVPVHGSKTLRPGTLRNILREAGVTIEQFRQVL